MSEPLRNYEQAAEWLGVPKRWLEDQVRYGKAAYTRLGKHVRFTQAQLNELVAQNERRPQGEAQDSTTPSRRDRKPLRRRPS